MIYHNVFLEKLIPSELRQSKYNKEEFKNILGKKNEIKLDKKLKESLMGHSNFNSFINNFSYCDFETLHAMFEVMYDNNFLYHKTIAFKLLKSAKSCGEYIEIHPFSTLMIKCIVDIEIYNDNFVFLNEFNFLFSRNLTFISKETTRNEIISVLLDDLDLIDVHYNLGIFLLSYTTDNIISKQDKKGCHKNIEDLYKNLDNMYNVCLLYTSDAADE